LLLFLWACKEKVKKKINYFLFTNNMVFKVKQSQLKGEILIPASKSHTIRAIAIATMAGGDSKLINPLVSADALSCVDAGREMGAIIQTGKDYLVKGISGKISKSCKMINVGNSGTTLRIFTAIAALSDQKITFDGDNSIRTRPMIPLLSALEKLGAKIESTGGKCPFTIQGPIKGGKTSVKAVSSQFLTALLIACPLAENDTEITVEVLNEQPYLDITLDWLKMQGIQYEQKGYDWFRVKGRQQYKPYSRQIPADFSTATFAIVAAAITGAEILIKGLDFSDSQGDKVIFSHLEKMGITVKHTDKGVLVKGGELKGMDIDMNATPDALPAMAVAACFAKGQTRLLNVPQARLKECDRIAAMTIELKKMGADITELADGLVINQSKLKTAHVHGHDDHRIVMAMTLAGMAIDGETIIDTAEAAGVTYPGFKDDFSALGAKIEAIEKA
jgi:3-phosphoshikimate 1-carboxyvinyltransferase